MIAGSFPRMWCFVAASLLSISRLSASDASDSSLSGVTAAPAPGNIVVLQSWAVGTASLAEYTMSGGFVRLLSNVPQPPKTPSDRFDLARDVVFGPDNALYVFNGGDFDITLARYDLSTGEWRQSTFGGWSTFSSAYDGGLAALDRYVFATDSGFGTPPNGVVRFDIISGTAQRFATTLQPIDLNIGLDGVLYVLDGASTATNKVWKFDPLTMAPLGSITLPYNMEEPHIAVAFDGSLLITYDDYAIMRFSPSGALLDTLTFDDPYLRTISDIDISSDGTVVLGTGFNGKFLVTDLSLDSYTSHKTSVGDDGHVAVALSPSVPEPGTWLLLLIGAGVSSARRVSRSLGQSGSFPVCAEQGS